MSPLIVSIDSISSTLDPSNASSIFFFREVGKGEGIFAYVYNRIFFYSG